MLWNFRKFSGNSCDPYICLHIGRTTLCIPGRWRTIRTTIRCAYLHPSRLSLVRNDWSEKCACVCVCSVRNVHAINFIYFKKFLPVTHCSMSPCHAKCKLRHTDSFNSNQIIMFGSQFIRPQRAKKTVFSRCDSTCTKTYISRPPLFYRVSLMRSLFRVHHKSMRCACDPAAVAACHSFRTWCNTF